MYLTKVAVEDWPYWVKSDTNSKTSPEQQHDQHAAPISEADDPKDDYIVFTAHSDDGPMFRPEKKLQLQRPFINERRGRRSRTVLCLCW